MKELLTIRCDGGTIHTRQGAIEIASGHLMRMLSFATHWRKQDGKVLLVTHRRCVGIEPILSRYREIGCEISYTEATACDSPEDARELCDRVAEARGRLIYLDGYQFGADYQRIIHDRGIYLVIQDDTGSQGPYAADVIVGAHIHAPGICYEALPHTKYLLGTKYALLGEEFVRIRSQKRIEKVATRLLVTLGSSDILEDTEKCLRGLLMLPSLLPQAAKWLSSLEVTVVVGATNPRHHVIEALGQRLSRERSCRTVILRDIRNMPAVMSEVDIAFSATGGTILELLCLGVPVALQIIHPVQVPIAKKLIEEGACTLVGDSRQLSPSEAMAMESRIGRHIFDLATSFDLRKRVSDRGSSLVDGNGVKRVYFVIEQLLSGKGKP